MGNFLKLTGAVTAGTLLAGGLIKLGSVIGNAFSKSETPAKEQPKAKAGRPKSSAKSEGNDSK